MKVHEIELENGVVVCLYYDRHQRFWTAYFANVDIVGYGMNKGEAIENLIDQWEVNSK